MALSPLAWLLRGLIRLRCPTPAGLWWLTPTLAVGSEAAVRDGRRLVRAGVRAVLDLRAAAPAPPPNTVPGALAYLNIPIEDFAAPTLVTLATATDWVLAHMDADGPVLVHCRAGLGRSVTVAIGTLVRIGYGLPEAYNLVRDRRVEVALSDAQLTVLRAFAASARSC